MATKERGKILFIVLILKIMLSLKDFKKYEVSASSITSIIGGIECRDIHNVISHLVSIDSPQAEAVIDMWKTTGIQCTVDGHVTTSIM
ncbi:MAG: hypothetical protein IPJ13_19125 [Saprospiraceae bacterium]|nr:hypothetical protein [Saprospiraceae bacterium]